MQNNETFSLYTFSFINKFESSMYKYVYFQIFRIKYFHYILVHKSIKDRLGKVRRTRRAPQYEQLSLQE